MFYGVPQGQLKKLHDNDVSMIICSQVQVLVYVSVVFVFPSLPQLRVRSIQRFA